MAKFRILSLDGGGIRGAFSAAFLAEVERALKIRVCEHFDLVAGTSTGGIIGLGIALGESAEKIETFYQSRGAKIFTPRRHKGSRTAGWVFAMLDHGMPTLAGGLMLLPARWLFDRVFARAGITMDSLLRTKYEAHELEVALREVFRARTLEDACTKVIIPSVDLVAGKPVVFKSPHLQDACTRDKAFSAVQIALATAAAPTYFPHAELREGSAYCDGGLWANNPVLIAIAEAQRIFAECGKNRFAGMTLEDIEVLSIGTGRGKFSLAPPDSAAGLFWWGPRVLDVMSLSQATGANTTAEFMLPGRIHRVDFELPDNSWKLDSVEHVERLVHLGREAAHEHMAQLRTKFFPQENPAAAA